MPANGHVRFGGGPEEKGGETAPRLRPTQLQVELSRRVRSDGGARRRGRTHHCFAMGPMLRSRL